MEENEKIVLTIRAEDIEDTEFQNNDCAINRAIKRLGLPLVYNGVSIEHIETHTEVITRINSNIHTLEMTVFRMYESKITGREYPITTFKFTLTIKEKWLQPTLKEFSTN